MFDTMKTTKAVAAICSALLVFLLIKWAAEVIYGGGGHGGEHEAQAYTIDTGEADHDAAAEAEVEVPFAEIYAAADAAAGEGLFRQCSACHKLDGNNGTGPHLDGVVERDIASVDGYAYSDALGGLDGAWTPEALDGFLTSPRDYANGTKMSFRGMAKVEDRANLIAYLATFGG